MQKRKDIIEEKFELMTTSELRKVEGGNKENFFNIVRQFVFELFGSK